MEIYRTEEEQINAIKSWWDKHGKSTILGVVIAALAFTGGRYWMQQRQVQVEQASVIYQALIEARLEERTAAAEALSIEILNDYQNTTYAQLTALLLASDAIEAGDDMLLAEQRLRLAMDSGKNKEVAHVARVRLARLLIAQEQAEAALNLLKSPPSDSWGALYNEVRGDAFLALGRIDEARAAYQQAQAVLDELQLPQALLSMKVDDLAVATPQ